MERERERENMRKLGGREETHWAYKALGGGGGY